jgi:CRISPR-associated protein Cas1
VPFNRTSHHSLETPIDWLHRPGAAILFVACTDPASDEQELDRMGLSLLDQILVVGQMQLTTQLIRACLRRGIPIAYLSSSGHCLGRLQPLEGGYRHRARRQEALPEEQRMAVARALISGKIANGRVVLQRFTRRGGRTEVESCLRRLGQLQTLTGRAPCANHLRGLEGSCGGDLFPQSWRAARG